MKSNLLRLVLPLAVLGFVAAGTAAAQTAIPGGTHSTTFVINKPGSYYLAGNRTMSDPGNHIIQITARDVTLDLRGFSLSHTGKGSGAGIRVETVENVEIRNGSIVAAAFMGVSAGAGQGLRLLDLRVVASAHNGIYSQASETYIERCHVMEAGSFGINLAFTHNVIVDTTVSGSALSSVALGKFGRAARLMVRGGSVGVNLGEGSTLEESSVIGSSDTGIFAGSHTTIRNCQITHHKTQGVYTLTAAVTLYGNRFAANPHNVNGSYVNGGGNVLP